MTTQLSLDLRRSSVARKDLASALVIFAGMRHIPDKLPAHRHPITTNKKILRTGSLPCEVIYGAPYFCGR